MLVTNLRPELVISGLLTYFFLVNFPKQLLKLPIFHLLCINKSCSLLRGSALELSHLYLCCYKYGISGVRHFLDTSYILFITLTHEFFLSSFLFSPYHFTRIYIFPLLLIICLLSSLIRNRRVSVPECSSQ